MLEDCHAHVEPKGDLPTFSQQLLFQPPAIQNQTRHLPSSHGKERLAVWDLHLISSKEDGLRESHESSTIRANYGGDCLSITI